MKNMARIFQRIESVLDEKKRKVVKHENWQWISQMEINPVPPPHPPIFPVPPPL